VENDGRSASMHECVSRDVVSDIDSLCQDALGEQVVYRGFLAGQERCTQERDGDASNDDVGGVGGP
jgi:hypothetical protein